MEKKNFTEIVRKVCAQFNPTLNVTPIQFRRFNVTQVFAGVVVPKDQIDSFLTIFSKLLNVSKQVMEKYYNRFNAHSEMVEALNKLQAICNTDQLETILQKGFELIQDVQEFKTSEVIPDIQNVEILRPVRKTIYNTEWIDYLIKYGDSWREYVKSDHVKCKIQEQIYLNMIDDVKKGKFNGFIYLRKKKNRKNKSKRKIIRFKKFASSQSNLHDQNQVKDTRLRKRKQSINYREESDEEDDDNNVFPVECILEERRLNNNTEYLVKWKGYDSDSAEWVKEEDILSRELIDDFYERKSKIENDIIEENNESIEIPISPISPVSDTSESTLKSFSWNNIEFDDSEDETENLLKTQFTENYDETKSKYEQIYDGKNNLKFMFTQLRQ